MSPGSEFYPDAEGALQIVFAFAQVVRDAGADDDAFRGLVFAGKSRAHGIRVFVGAQGEAAVGAARVKGAVLDGVPPAPLTMRSMCS